MTSYRKLNNGQCWKQNRNRHKPCEVLTDGRVIPSCSNIYGIDGWPASVPQQSNFRFTNGISGHKPPNGFRRYIFPMYLYNGILYKPHNRFIYSDELILKSGKTFFTVNNVKYVLVEDLRDAQLRLFNLLQNGFIKKIT